jgi:molybdopterin/thiamine biosynthesis adenylyltransferase
MSPSVRRDCPARCVSRVLGLSVERRAWSVERGAWSLEPERGGPCEICSRTSNIGTSNIECQELSTMNQDQQVPVELERYARQMRYPPIGVGGQRRLLASRVLVVGCGALGSVLANTLARSGVGTLRIVDRDFLEMNNLQRQVLYDEQDVASGLPKAIAAKNRLEQINSQIKIEAIVADVDQRNVGQLVQDVDLITDGTDNFEIRYLLNDAAIYWRLPWIYGGCIGAVGQSMTILPGETPCFRCLHPEPPPPGTLETCDSAGILAPIVNVIASIQACESLKILTGHRDAVCRELQVFELWDNRIRQIKLDALHEHNQCPACVKRKFEWLTGERGSHTAVLCGRNAVQLSFPQRVSISLEALEAKLQGIGRVTRNPYLLRLTVQACQITVFPDGRAIINGTEDVAEAKTLYARYIGA